jgi:glycine/D-amino acid oxidase-like deaminating enzyme
MHLFAGLLGYKYKRATGVRERRVRGNFGVKMKSHAEIVVIGGGIYGAQVAYHLAKNGRKDVVIVEKGEIASGESSHAAGLVTQFATSQAMLRFRMYSVELYSELGLFDHVGSLRVASSKEQLLEMERSVSPGIGLRGHRSGRGGEAHAADFKEGFIRRHLSPA